MTHKKFDFFKELKHRNVYRVATVYAITSWIIIEVASTIFPYLNLPEWLVTAVIIFALIGFPVSLVLAWAFEMSPDGFVRTASPEAENNPLPAHKRKPFTGTITIVILVVLLIGQFVYFGFIRDSGPKKEDSIVEASFLPQKSIAVLPFKNLSNDSDNEYFSDGIMEAILNNLSRIKDLKVVSRTSVELYRDDIKPIPEIAAELEVAHILEGSVQKIGDNVRITVQLIAADKDKHIWAAHYDRDISDIFVVQSEIAKTIAENLMIILTTEERELIENAPTTNLKAYDLYLRATKPYSSADKEKTQKDFETIIGMLKETIILDDKFALAYGELGLYLSKLNKFDVPESIWADSAMAMLDKSLQLDPANVDAYRYKSYIYLDLKMEEKVKESLLKGLEYNPNDFFILKYLSRHYERIGDYDRGMDYMLKSLAVNKPDYRYDFFLQLTGFSMRFDLNLLKKFYQKALESNPESISILQYLALNELCEQNFEKALQYLLKMENVNLEKTFNARIAYGYTKAKQYKKADEYYNKAGNQSDVRDYNFRYRGLVKIKLGELEEGQAMIQAFKDSFFQANNKIKQTKDSYVCLNIARIYAYENNKNEAFAWLEKSVEYGKDTDTFWTYFYLISDPYFDDLREDDRFKTISQPILEIRKNRNQLLRGKLAEYHSRNQLIWLTLDD